jgi:hypothetical protein
VRSPGFVLAATSALAGLRPGGARSVQLFGRVLARVPTQEPRVA